MDQPWTCATCGRKLSPKLAQCPYCKVAEDQSAPKAPAAASGTRPCPNCESPLEPGATTCQICGHGRSASPASKNRLLTIGAIVVCCAMLAIIAIVAVRRLGKANEEKRVEGAGGKSEDAMLLESAFESFRTGSYPDYEKLTVTPADFMAMRTIEGLSEQQERATGRKPNMVGRRLMAKQTYEGSVLAPEQRKLQEEDFRKVAAGGSGFIDFRNAKYKGVGTLVMHDSLPLIDGAPVPVRVYSLRIEAADGERDTRDLAPLFVVADYGGSPAIVGLRMP